MPPKDCCFGAPSKDICYKLANLFVGTLLLTLGIIQITTQASQFKTFVLGIYSIIFGITLLIAEMGVHVIVSSYCTFLDNVFGRGLFYIFVGVLLLEAYPWYQAMISGIVIFIGFLYTIFHCVPSLRPTKVASFHGSSNV